MPPKHNKHIAMWLTNSVMMVGHNAVRCWGEILRSRTRKQRKTWACSESAAGRRRQSDSFSAHHIVTSHQPIYNTTTSRKPTITKTNKFLLRHHVWLSVLRQCTINIHICSANSFTTARTSVDLQFSDRRQTWTYSCRDHDLNSASEPSALQPPKPGTLFHSTFIKSATNTQTFKRRLKTFLFCKSYNIPLPIPTPLLADWRSPWFYLLRVCFSLYFIV